MTSQRDQFVDIAVAQIGVLQYEWADRCGWTDGTTDCSGLVGGSARRADYEFASCPNSSGWARICHNAVRPQWMNDRYGPDPWTGSTTQGTGITAQQARDTKGALGWHGPDQGRDGDGAKGHIKISRGDGTSVEAVGHARDVVSDTFIDDADTYYALLPGMTGFEGQEPPPAPAPIEDDNMQTYKSLKDPAAGAARCVRVDNDGVIALFGGAVLYRLEPAGKKVTPTITPFGRFVMPDFVAGSTYLGSTEWGVRDGFVTLALRPDGSVATRHYSFVPLN